MANPMLPIADSPETIDISTPPSSERSRSQRAGGAPLTEAVAMMPQNSGFSHRGVLPAATREGGPNVHSTGGSGNRVFNQMNVNHEQRVIIDQQHYVQNNQVLIQTHDPAYTEMLEQTAEARHRMAIAEAEAQANHRHEVLTGSLKEALQMREAQEINQARMFLRENEENIKSEAVQHVRAHEAQCTEKVQAYQRILDANLRQSMATKESEIERLRNLAKGASSGRTHQKARRACDATKSSQPKAPKYVGLPAVAATSSPSCGNRDFGEDGRTVCYLCSDPGVYS